MKDLSQALAVRLEKMRSTLNTVLPLEEKVQKAKEDGEVDDDDEDDEIDMTEEGACLVAVAGWAMAALGDISTKYAGKVSS